uniref:Uncharacterized protein n=1 Tax=Rhizophora mucronata TaxID=61149 RepID=A0A2P2P4K7_RHIMU
MKCSRLREVCILERVMKIVAFIISANNYDFRDRSYHMF